MQHCPLGRCPQTAPCSDPRQPRQIRYSRILFPALAKTTRTERPRQAANSKSVILRPDRRHSTSTEAFLRRGMPCATSPPLSSGKFPRQYRFQACKMESSEENGDKQPCLPGGRSGYSIPVLLSLRRMDCRWFVDLTCLHRL